MPYARLFKEIDQHLDTYQNGTITISEDIDFSMYQTVRQITHYTLSKYLGGQNDDQGRRMPFQNIGNAIVDLEWRAKNIDRKNVEAHATDDDQLFALFVTKEVQQWMKESNFGKTIDDYQRKKSSHGSVLLKKTENAKELKIDVVQWENTAVNPADISGGPKIEKNSFTLLDLMKRRGTWDDASIEDLLSAAKKQKKTEIDVYDVEAEFERGIVEDTDADDIALFNVIYGQIGDKKHVLYTTELTESRFKHDKRKEAENRDFGIGVWEEVFEPQIWTNAAVIAEQEAMELGGKVVITTNKKGLPSAVQLVNGEIIDLEADEYFKPVQLTSSALPEFGNQIDRWFLNMQRDQSAYPGVTGEEPKASTPYQSLALQSAQSSSIFNKRRDQDGYFLLGVITDWVLPFIVKKIKREHTFSASYSPQELRLLDEAIRNLHVGNYAKSAILSPDFMSQQPPTANDVEALHQHIQEQLNRQGSSRVIPIPKNYFTLEQIKKKVRFDITDEMSDNQGKLNALAATLQQLAPDDPGRKEIIQQMMDIAGIADASFGVRGTIAMPQPTQTPSLPTASAQIMNAALPEGQK